MNNPKNGERQGMLTVFYNLVKKAALLLPLAAISVAKATKKRAINLLSCGWSYISDRNCCPSRSSLYVILRKRKTILQRFENCLHVTHIALAGEVCFEVLHHVWN